LHFAGHYYDKTSLTCVRCSVGYYQPDVGKTFCYACPGNTTTDYDAAQSLSSCKGKPVTSKWTLCHITS